MNASVDVCFIGAEPEQGVENHLGDKFRVVNCTFQELGPDLIPIKGRYLVVEVWNEKIETLSDLKIGEPLRLDVEVITRRKADRPDRYKSRITLVSMTKISV